ncbi:MAG: protein kinase domain-containing protein, partial [Planctomycetaceae bacterium]
MVKIPPLPRRDQAADLSVLQDQFPELSLVLDASAALAESPPTQLPEPSSPPANPPGERNTCTVDTNVASVQLGNRYRLDRLLGEGNYGRVWLGYDLELRRQVAIKVPLPGRFQTAAEIDSYRGEARTVASLPHHAHLVPVFDVGRMPNGSIYLVSGYIAGTTLQAELTQGLPTLDRAVAILSAIADALLHAHARGVIHRDVKPANILIETATASPYLSDFGLAIREDESLAATPAGSPAYMSPEQAVPNGQPLDGRSDLFSLGIIAYEMFTGKLPFRGKRISDVIQAILLKDPTPPRDVRPDLPPELERICLRLLQKRPSDRYENAQELILDLTAWANRGQRVAPPAEESPVEAVVSPPGLRAFTAADAPIFLDLLPGQVDRDGLPDAVSFWKRKLEATSDTFRVGLLLGPSGSGKSSLVRAGVLPRLAQEITSVYLQATPDRTEEDLQRELQAAIPDLPSNLSLIDAFRWLRKRAGQEAPGKTVVVLDQFEQWLNAHPVSASEDLVQALAHCDGRRLQTLLLVRDDFGLAANRLLRKLDIPLLENQNWRTSDLFDADHAERVLIKLGRGYGGLPPPPTELTETQHAFTHQATGLLADKGQVVPVRLALFADLVKRKPWEPDTLRALGGMDQIGAAFLEETFGDGGTNPRYREASECAQRVLRSLLPPLGTDIKGHQRTVEELASEAQLPEKSRRLADTLAILDGELKLITATETGRARKGGVPRYQLTHDYLVPALRVWLERKQRETREGQAALLLAERSALWNVKSEDRHLPTLAEHLRIRRWTRASTRREPERKMLARAAVVHGRSTALTLTLLTGLVLGGWWFRREQSRRDLERSIAATVAQLETAQPGDWARVRAPLSEPQAREVARRELDKVFGGEA